MLFQEMNFMSLKSWFIMILPFVAMVLAESLDVGLSTLSKAAMSKGMNHFVFVVYSNALASLIFLPTLYFQRKKRPPLSYSLICKFCLLSFVGITLMQNCVFSGVKLSSPTLASAMSNLVPALTFVLAIIFRMEKLDIKNSKSQIKILGTLVSISGALIVTLYKGYAIIVPSGLTIANLASTNDWIIGGLFLFVAGFCLSVLNTFLAAILNEYPSQMTVLWFYYFFGTVQCAALTLAVERDLSIWNLTANIEIISVLYSGVFGSVVTYSIMAWCVNIKGPVFVAMFKPVGIAVAAFLSTIFLRDTLYIGSIIGAIVIVIGFYGVIWSQSEERKAYNYGVIVDDGLDSSSQRISILRNGPNI